ncbi:tRNA/rRNA methyltransferase SpoU [Sulfuricella denitrificans skB26]|uniref:tRNA/rRNA methyltransferase SpoU n=1 Tax=Sulfuricella denitrificans (strain DSM 22764 / NBRC 105220 / skB26) TaxID=1163617 RepID=S6AA88_SULDS|nr:tRNA/rRNA methyltransferase SpoU [Sulfuricella denitrificans skB26]
MLKSARKLAASSKERKKAGKTLLDGIHLVTAYHQAGGVPEAILVSVSAQDHPEIRDFIHNQPPENLIVLSDELFREISTVDTPTGIVALIRIPQPVDGKVNCCVLLEDIQDPGNLGSILRSAAAAGIGQIYLSTGCVDAWSPKVLRAGMGAHFHLSIHESSDLVAVARNFQGQVVATTLGTEKTLFSLDLSGQTAFVIGNEGAGVSESLLEAADSRVMIPMPGAAESLNAAAAAAICFFERVRQIG